MNGYKLICKKCGYVSVCFIDTPNETVPSTKPDFYPRRCEFCGNINISVDKSLQEYAEEWEESTNTKLDLTNKHCLLHPMIEQDYITRHPEEFDENLYIARLNRQNEVAAKRAADKALPHCPKCRSTSIVTQKQGFGVGKAAAGVILTGGLLGAAAGGINANKNWNVCQKCGHKWKI